MPHLDDLAALAKRAFYATSWTPEERGERTLRMHERQLEEDLVTVRELGGDEARYIANYRKYLVAWLSAHSRCISSAVVGPAKFPTRKAQKANDSEHNRMGEFLHWRERALAAIARDARRAARAEITPDMEVMAMREKIEAAERFQEQMKLANKIVRKHKANPEAAVPVLMEQIPMTEEQARNVIKPDYMGRIGFDHFELTNNNANIKRMRQRLAELEAKAASSGAGPKRLPCAGGEIEMNFEDDRIRILFDEKPDADTIAKLKRNGFRWSPKNKAWQRQLTANAIHAVAAVTETDMKTLFEVYHESGR